MISGEYRDMIKLITNLCKFYKSFFRVPLVSMLPRECYNILKIVIRWNSVDIKLRYRDEVNMISGPIRFTWVTLRADLQKSV